jgi:hypothetical protein
MSLNISTEDQHVSLSLLLAENNILSSLNTPLFNACISYLEDDINGLSMPQIELIQWVVKDPDVSKNVLLMKFLEIAFINL